MQKKGGYYGEFDEGNLVTLSVMLIVGVLFKASGFVENFQTTPFYVAALFLVVLGAFVWIFVYKR